MLFKGRIDNKGDFVSRLKEKISYKVLEDLPVISGKNTTIISDQIILITGEKASTPDLTHVKCA